MVQFRCNVFKDVVEKGSVFPRLSNANFTGFVEILYSRNIACARDSSLTAKDFFILSVWK